MSGFSGSVLFEVLFVYENYFIGGVGGFFVDFEVLEIIGVDGMYYLIVLGVLLGDMLGFWFIFDCFCFDWD